MPESLYRRLIYPLMRYIPNWSSLNRMGRSRLLKTSYFWLFAVPILAQLLIKVGPELSVAFWGASIRLTLRLPFSWKMFFYSSVAFSIASFIYSLRCPAFVRDYDKFSDFTDEGKGSRQILDTFLSQAWEQTGASETFRHGLVLNDFINRFLADDNEPQVLDRENSVCIERLTEERLAEHKLPEAFWDVRNELDESRPATRFVCAACYSIGFLLISFVAIQNLFFVVRLTF